MKGFTFCIFLFFLLPYLYASTIGISIFGKDIKPGYVYDYDFDMLMGSQTKVNILIRYHIPTFYSVSTFQVTDELRTYI